MYEDVYTLLNIYKERRERKTEVTEEGEGETEEGFRVK
jgi:hypothetical protein